MREHMGGVEAVKCVDELQGGNVHFDGVEP